MKLLICDLDGVINGSSDARADLVPKIYSINVAKFTCNQ